MKTTPPFTLLTFVLENEQSTISK